MSKTVPIKPSKTPENQEIPPAGGTETPASPPAANRQPAKRPQRPERTSPTFFEKVSRIGDEEWKGGRAFMYVYCTEPICNLKMLGEWKYLFRSSRPITDLQQIMEDYGSFKGYMTLNQRATGKDLGDEIDRYDFEIYNPKYPPKIPRRAWLSDPRNERWAALLPKEEAPGSVAASMSSFLEAIKTYGDIRREVREELEPAAAAVATATPVVAQPAVDPWAAAEKILQMRSDNPMVAILMQRMEAMDRSAEEARKREFELQKELRQQSQQPQSNGMNTVKELINSFKELLPDIKQLIPGLGENAAPAATGRGSRMNAWEFFQQPLTELIKGMSPAFPYIVQAMMTPRAQGEEQAQPGTGNGVVAPVNRPPLILSPQQKLLQLVDRIFTPMIRKFAIDAPAEELGAEFAAWMYDGFTPDELKSLQAIGPEQIVRMFQQSAVWPQIGDAEKFTLFAKGFCSWKPEGEEEPPADPGVIDLDTETEEAHV